MADEESLAEQIGRPDRIEKNELELQTKKPQKLSQIF
jgi:hypothetical protein